MPLSKIEKGKVKECLSKIHIWVHVSLKIFSEIYALSTWESIIDLHLDMSYLMSLRDKTQISEKNLSTMKSFEKKSSNSEHMKFSLG